MIISWLCMFCKKKNKNRTGINIPTSYYNYIAKQIIIQIKQMLPQHQTNLITKLYFQQNITNLLKKLSMEQVLRSVFL